MGRDSNQKSKQNNNRILEPMTPRTASNNASLAFKSLKENAVAGAHTDLMGVRNFVVNEETQENFIVCEKCIAENKTIKTKSQTADVDASDLTDIDVKNTKRIAEASTRNKDSDTFYNRSTIPDGNNANKNNELASSSSVCRVVRVLDANKNKENKTVDAKPIIVDADNISDTVFEAMLDDILCKEFAKKLTISTNETERAANTASNAYAGKANEVSTYSVNGIATTVDFSSYFEHLMAIISAIPLRATEQSLNQAEIDGVVPLFNIFDKKLFRKALYYFNDIALNNSIVSRKFILFIANKSFKLDCLTEQELRTAILELQNYNLQNFCKYRRYKKERVFNALMMMADYYRINKDAPIDMLGDMILNGLLSEIIHQRTISKELSNLILTHCMMNGRILRQRHDHKIGQLVYLLTDTLFLGRNIVKETYINMMWSCDILMDEEDNDMIRWYLTNLYSPNFLHELFHSPADVDEQENSDICARAKLVKKQ